MPRRCVVAGCSTIGGEGYSLHEFPRDKTIRTKWTQAVKRNRSNWDGPSASSLLCSKHFEQDCFVVEGVRYREAMGIPAQKRLKPNAIPTIFPRPTLASRDLTLSAQGLIDWRVWPRETRPTHGETGSKSTLLCKRTAYEKRQRKAVSVNMHAC